MDFEDIISKAEQAAQAEAAAPVDLAPYFLDYTKDIEKPVTVISDPSNHDRIIVSEQNLLVIAGEAKSRKSFLASLLLMDFYTQHPDRRGIVIDTEQAEWNVLNVARRVCRGLGWDYAEAYADKRLQIAHLRPYTKAQRRDIVEAIIRQEKPYFCIIDGVRDLVQDFNDSAECSELVDQLLKWTEVYECAIGVVIHTNKDGETVRGHLGAELINKAETTLFCKKADGDATTVSSYRARNPDIDTFTFSIDARCVPTRATATKTESKTYTCGTPKETAALNALELKEQARELWLVEIRNAAMCATSTAEKYFNDFVQEGYLRLSGKNSNTYGHFRLYGPEPLKLWALPQEQTLQAYDTEDNNADPF